MKLQKIGIYKITCKVNNKVYIGSSNDIHQRWARHKWELNTKTHPNPHLQNAWNKYGPNSFSFEIIHECNVSDLFLLEQDYINKSNCLDQGMGFNKCSIVGPPPVAATREFKIKDPNGVIHVGKNVTEFCKKHGLNRISVYGLLNQNNNSYSYKGWTLPHITLPCDKLKDSAGNIYSIKHGDRTRFCEKHNLSHGEIIKVLRGYVRQHKRWSLP